MSNPFHHPIFRQVVFWIAVVFCLSPYSDPPLALLCGLIIALFIGHPYAKANSKVTKMLLQVSIVGLGMGMNLKEAAKAGQEGFVFTAVTIVLTLIAGVLLGKLFGLDNKIRYLISAGTAICGGSAIAAVSPIIDAEESQISVSLGTIFVLNSVALFIFPLIGHSLHMSDNQFGVWAAIAIHDTSSVVGASGKYSDAALHIATTVKLVRSLWIIPLSFVTLIAFKKKNTGIKFPYFILFFIAAMAIHTYIPMPSEISTSLVMLAKKGMVLTLFLIGTGLSREALKKVGLRPLLLGLVLWILVSVSSLLVVMNTL
jgi:uncharacterized integral membrane protein (TIGR00698 family)